MSKEEWKDIQGYEGLYQVSNLGRVKSLPRNGTILEEKIINQYIDRYGYNYVALSKNNKKKKYKVHRLVAEAFIDNSENKSQINHKDENKKNNNVYNLEWCSAKYNLNYGNRMEKINKKVVMKKDNKKVAVFKSIKEASEKTNIDSSSIAKCCKNKRKTAGGYVWRYYE